MRFACRWTSYGDARAGRPRQGGEGGGIGAPRAGRLTAVSEALLLIDNLERLREHLEAVRSGSGTARDDLAAVLQIMVGGDGGNDGYGLIHRATNELGLGPLLVEGWAEEVPESIDDEPVLLALRGSPRDGAQIPLEDRMTETCLRFALPGIEPASNWSFRDLIKSVRNKFGSHADKRPPRWLQELRYFPAGDADAVTYLLWRAGEEVAATVSAGLAAVGCDVEPFLPDNSYLNGVDLTVAYVLGRPGSHLDVRAHVRCESWVPASRRAIVGAMFGDEPFIFGLEGDGRLSLTTGRAGSTVADLARQFRRAGMPKAGRNDPCPCGSGRKFKHCHGR